MNFINCDKDWVDVLTLISPYFILLITMLIQNVREKRKEEPTIKAKVIIDGEGTFTINSKSGIAFKPDLILENVSEFAAYDFKVSNNFKQINITDKVATDGVIYSKEQIVYNYSNKEKRILIDLSNPVKKKNVIYFEGTEDEEQYDALIYESEVYDITVTFKNKYGRKYKNNYTLKLIYKTLSTDGMLVDSQYMIDFNYLK